jgi:hypothetical protein
MKLNFTKVPGIYRTREGGYVYVKYIHSGTDYPVIGCKAQLMTDKTVQWASNIMQVYRLDGRCSEEKDQAEDIVEYDSARVVLIFRPGIPDHTYPVLCRLLGKYQILYRNAGRWWKTNGEPGEFSSDDLEWAELP